MADEEEYQGFEWKGNQVSTTRDICDALSHLQSEGEGAEFMRRYQAVNNFAYENVGYIVGYLNEETRKRVYKFTRTHHPVLVEL